jgi:2-methylcitrate dehydratase PrpD
MSTGRRRRAYARGVGATNALVEAVRDLRWGDVPEEAREVARHCLLDFLGVTLAGSREPPSEMLVAAAIAGEGASRASLIGRSERASRLSAALVNGVAAHALDFDDTHTLMNGHPSAPVLPALLALVDTEDATGADLLVALVAGIELECRLSVLLGPAHYGYGFHSTGTLGTFGAAAACAHLLGLDREQWLHALGLAATQAAGLKSGFGTMAKPLNAGHAASAGLLAALLARRGFTADPIAIEASQGFALTHSDGRPSQAQLTPYVGRFLARDTLFKFHAACYLTHAAIDAAAALRAAPGFDARDVSAVEVRVSPALLHVCTIAEPETGLEGKFSLRATTAMALLGDDTGDPDAFTNERMADPELVALRDRVRVETVTGMSATRALVTIATSAGKREAEVDTGVPATDLAAQRERLERKFLRLATPVLGRARAEHLAHHALRADELASSADIVRDARLG